MTEKRAKREAKNIPPPPNDDLPTDEDDSIEILEVVGMDEGKAEAPPREEPDPSDSIPYTRQQLYDMLLRKQAEFENARKRAERDKEESQRWIWKDLLTRLLPILDNFQRALAEPAADPRDPFRQGVSLTFQQMMDILGREGLEEIRSVGEPFDPHVHEAVETRAVQGFEEGIVLEELRKGYRFRGQLLRPALVKVSSKVGGSEGG
ncbi:MAG TPA: nucleotide exchange factor GrpE [Candidatus Polarisedimenticolia bacterium]|jgi:molecular chaperone GrpE|nr:nucleotide exchange factor GrpE [Candidatus Polarisedimenticolia bacterium]